MYRYTRQDLIRILRISAHQLVAWEKSGLVASADSYTFFDLLQVKKVRDLCARRVRPAEIRQSIVAMQKQAAGMENPLLEAAAEISSRHRVAFRHDGRLLEPIAGQFMSMISQQRTASTRRAAGTQSARATVPRLRRRCCARAPPLE